ncbi:type VI secretion protein IcmF/TssM N-terminal domain-containing protein [Tundrisphaera sp. TA3]|uniref:type VI secretion protein IcmF/TssM N-terminal domain-containing protein n=1 Tax=Tundrisphaera sp. TA3 TaxID=3435775 RepID=UPI003EBB65C6
MISWAKRWFWTFLAAAVLVALGVLFLFVLPRRTDPNAFLDRSLPPAIADHFWAWIYALILGVFAFAWLLARAIRRARAAAPGGAEIDPADLATGPARYPELEEAWRQIRIRLSQAQIDPGARNVILLIAPHEDWAAALVRSAGLPLFVQAPETDAPIHAFATQDALLISCSGMSAFGTQEADGVTRIEALCRLLLAENRDCPVIRGVVALFPAGWTTAGESVRWASALRDDLNAIERVTRVRPPVFALFPEMETVPGFAEFIRRMPREARQQRVGFAVPRDHALGDDVSQRGLVWLSGWFHAWALNLMAGDPLDADGNGRLFVLDHEIRRYRSRWRKILDAALATHRESEPALFRGVYLTATGVGADDQAFSAGLFRGPRARIVADHAATTWTAQAEADDRRYRRIALWVGLVGALLTLGTWAFILLRIVHEPIWWLAPLAQIIAWALALRRILRRPAPPSATS